MLLNVFREDVALIYNKLGSLYQSKSLVNKLLLQIFFFHFRMDDKDLDVMDHLNVYNTLVCQFTFVGIQSMEEEDK